MARDMNGKRNFALRGADGETDLFSGRTPRQAALKDARRFDPADSEADANREGLRLREMGTHKVHIYEGWTWREDAPKNKPDWMPSTITEANVSNRDILLQSKVTTLIASTVEQ
jgi:hypothetical protein